MHQLHGVVGASVTKKSRAVTEMMILILLVDVWQSIFEFVPKLPIAPIEHDTGLQVQSEIRIDVPVGNVAQNDHNQL